MSGNTLVLVRPRSALGTVRRLLVTLREPEPPRYRSAGFLTCEADGTFTFAYLRSEVAHPDFRPLPGLPATGSRLQSTHLFPLFAERVISSRRPDREETMHALGLPADAAPFEVLSRSGGRRVGDMLELLEVPHVDAGGLVELTFFAHGVRYQSEAAQARIGELHPGQELAMVPEPNNPANPEALAVRDEPHRLGYVPDPLLRLAHDVRSGDGRLTVAQVNGPEVGFHFRLLVTMSGRVSYPPFSEPEFETV